MPVLLISDLHLSPARPAIARLFCGFLQQQATRASALYILGDLFEYWIGDEAVDQGPLIPIVDAMAAVTRAGVPIFLMHGNRDFLLGARFAQATGATLLGDPHRLDLAGTPTLLTHGDQLCTDDREYQQFRAQIRQPEWVQAFLQKTFAERIAIAEQYRELSRNATSMKASEIMDVNQEAVQVLMQEHQVRRLIHGHTHRPACHEFVLADGTAATRIVLGDWYEQGSVLECADDGLTLRAL